MDNANYISEECEAVASPGHISVVRIGHGGKVEFDLRPHADGSEWTPSSSMIMLELTEEQRLQLDLPACGAVTGGTALCLGRKDRIEEGVVTIPRAPKNWDELVCAELEPLKYIGIDLKGVDAIIIPEMACGQVAEA